MQREIQNFRELIVNLLGSPELKTSTQFQTARPPSGSRFNSVVASILKNWEGTSDLSHHWVMQPHAPRLQRPQGGHIVCDY